MFFFDTCNAVAAREDRKQKYWRLWRRHLGLSLTLWRHTVKRDILNMVCDCWFPCPCVYWSLVKARKIVWESQVIDSSSITQSEALWVWRCDATTSNSIQDGGAQSSILKHYFFSLIKVSTFICKREISGFSSPLRMLDWAYYPLLYNNVTSLCIFIGCWPWSMKAHTHRWLQIHVRSRHWIFIV